MNEQQLAALVDEARRKLGVRKGANRIYRVPPGGPPKSRGVPRGANQFPRSPPTPAATRGTQPAAPIPGKFRRRAIVLAVYGQVADALDSTAATTELRIQVGGTSELVTDG